jgi:hypothetical protein
VVAGAVTVSVEVVGEVAVVLVCVVAVVVTVAVGVVVVAVLDWRHCCGVDVLIVDAPASRSARSVPLIVEGRLATALAKLRAALWAATQWPAASAEETWSS